MRPVSSKRQMKRVFQIAAALVVLLMAGQPLLAAATCEMGMAASPASCPMGMREMGPDCPMAQGMSAECVTRCFNCAAAKDLVLPAVPAKPKVIAAEFTASPEIAWRVAEHAHPAFLDPATNNSSPPPPYLLNCVFRI